MPAWASSAPRKKLPPPTTTATCVPCATTSASCSAIRCTIVGVDADAAAAERLAGELEQHPLVAAAVGGLEGGGRGQRRGVSVNGSPSLGVGLGSILPHRDTGPVPEGDGAGGACTVRPAVQAWPTSKRAKRSTVSPASSRICLTVRLGSVIDGCSSRTKSL